MNSLSIIKDYHKLHPLRKPFHARDIEWATRKEKNIDFKLEKKGWEVGEAITISRRCDGFDWCFNGQEMMHERIFYPFNIFKDIVYTYWTRRSYTDKKLAKKMAKKYKGEVTEEFYCDPENPSWFISFDDFELAAKYCEETLNGID